MCYIPTFEQEEENWLKLEGLIKDSNDMGKKGRKKRNKGGRNGQLDYFRRPSSSKGEAAAIDPVPLESLTDSGTEVGTYNKTRRSRKKRPRNNRGTKMVGPNGKEIFKGYIINTSDGYSLGGIPLCISYQGRLIMFTESSTFMTHEAQHYLGSEVTYYVDHLNRAQVVEIL